MKQPTKQEIEEATEWLTLLIVAWTKISREHGVGHFGFCERDVSHLHTLRTALEQYKPKTISREWVKRNIR